MTHYTLHGGTVSELNDTFSVIKKQIILAESLNNEKNHSIKQLE